MKPPSADLLRLVLRWRRLVVAVLLALAVAAALPVLAPAAPAASDVLVAAHDLTPGAVLSAADLATTALPRAAVPDGVVTDPSRVVGQVVAGAVRRGEPITDVRLLGPALLAGLPDDQVAAPVRVADPAAAALLRAGDRVDVVAASATPDGPPGAATVAAAVRVLAVPTAAISDEGALVVVATTPTIATRLAGVAVSSRLSVVLRP
jgi:pilus assembly protein CpaB